MKMKKYEKKIPYDNFFISNKDKEDENNHHLFSYYQIREELIKICGEPETDEQHQNLHRAIKKIWRKMPQFKINKKHHYLIHNNNRDNETITIGEVRKIFSDMYNNLPDSDEDLLKTVKEMVKEIDKKIEKYTEYLIKNTRGKK